MRTLGPVRWGMTGVECSWERIPSYLSLAERKVLSLPHQGFTSPGIAASKIEQAIFYIRDTRNERETRTEPRRGVIWFESTSPDLMALRWPLVS